MDHYDVFISYRRVDVEFASEINQKLVDTSRKVWVDWENLPPGVEGFTDEIQSGIEGSDAFICILSPSYLESEYCLAELRSAIQLKKRIIPIVLCKFDGMAPPEGIAHINWIYFTPHAGRKNTFEESFPKVIKALEADYEHAREHTRLLLRAIDWEKNEKNRSNLLKDAEIGKAERWQVAGTTKNPSPTELHGQYILASRANQRRQQRQFMFIISILLGLAFLAAIFAGYQWNNAARSEEKAIQEKNNALIQKATAVSAQSTAVEAEQEAVAQRAVAEQNAQEALISSLAAQSQLIQSRQLGILVALEAYKTSLQKGEVSTAVQSSLRSALVDFSGVPVHSYQEPANSVQFSPDNRWLLGTTVNGQMQVSDLSQGLDAQPITLTDQGLFNPVMSPESKWLAAIANETPSEIWLWTMKDLTADHQVLALPDDSSAVRTISFGTPRSRRYWLAAGLEDGRVYTWDAANLSKAQPTLLYQDKYKRSVSGITFSPNGNWMAVAFDYPIDGAEVNPVLLIWNLQNPAGDPVPLDLFGSTISLLTFSSGDKWLVGASGDQKVRLWSMGTVLTDPSSNVFPLENRINDITFSSDERWLAVVDNSKAQVWSLNSFSKVELPGYKDWILSASFSPDNLLLATGDYAGQIRMWKVADFANPPLLESQASLYHGFDVIVSSLEFSSDGSRLAASGDQQVRMWDFPISVSAPVRAAYQYFDTGLDDRLLLQPNDKSLVTMDLTQDDPVTMIDAVHRNEIFYNYSLDQRYLAAVSLKQLQVWDLQNPENPVFENELQDGQFASFIFTGDGRWFAYALYNQIYVVDLQRPGGFPTLLSGNRKASPILGFYAIDNWLVSQSSSEILAWDTTDFSLPIKLSGSSSASVTLYESDSNWILVQESGVLNLWKTSDLLSDPISIKGETPGDIGDIVYDRWLDTYTSEDFVYLWDLSNPAEPLIESPAYFWSNTWDWFVYADEEGTWQLLNLAGSGLKPTALTKSETLTTWFSSNDQWLAISTEKENSTVLYELKQGLPKTQLPNYTPVDFSPDERWMIVQDENGEYRLYDLQTKKPLSSALPPSGNFIFSPDGKWLTAIPALNNGTMVLLIDLQNPENVYQLTGHTDVLNGRFFTEDGRSLLTYSFDGTVRIWDLKNPNVDPVVFSHGSNVFEIYPSANGKWLITRTNQNMYIWQWDFEDVQNLACRLVGRNLTRGEWERYMVDQEYHKTCEQWPG
jgi:WD40 repeat protein